MGKILKAREHLVCFWYEGKHFLSNFLMFGSQNVLENVIHMNLFSSNLRKMPFSTLRKTFNLQLNNSNATDHKPLTRNLSTYHPTPPLLACSRLTPNPTLNPMHSHLTAEANPSFTLHRDSSFQPQN